ncbi:MAG: lipid II flippase MurJ [Gammaproteobacteria bacterium]
MILLIQRGLRWFSGQSRLSINRRIFAAAVTVGAFTLLVKAAALIKELVVAFRFGTSRELDALLIAFAIPTFGISVLGGSIQAALIPTYLETLHKKGKQAASALLGTVSSYYLVLLLLIAVILMVSAPWLLRIMAGGFSEQSRLLTQHLLYWLLPVLVLTGYARLMAAVLVAENHYAISTVAAVATPIALIMSMSMFFGTLGIYSLVVGFLVGAAVEMLILIWVSSSIGYQPTFAWGPLSVEFHQVRIQYLPMIIGTMLMSGMIVTDQAMAALLPAGGVSALNYANKVPSVIMNLSSAAIGTAILPYFSRMVTAADWKGVRHVCRTYAGLILVTCVPLTVILILLSGAITRHLYQHGAFSATDSQEVAYVQICLLIQIPFYTISILAVRLISALKENTLLMYGAAVSLVANAVLDYGLMQFMGVAGIALSTSLVYALATIYLWLMAFRSMNKNDAGI